MSSPARGSSAGASLVVCRFWTKEDHERETLEHWADLLVGIVPFARGALSKSSSPMRPLGMTDYQRQQLADCLRRIAQTPAALEALTHSAIPRSAHRNYKIATDYAATYERLGKSEAALLEVMTAWGIKRSTVLSAHKKLCEAAQREIQRLERDHAIMERETLLMEISRTLRSQKN